MKKWYCIIIKKDNKYTLNMGVYGENINDEPAYKSIDYDRIQRLKVLKQADLVQLATLFPNEISLKQKLYIKKL